MTLAQRLAAAAALLLSVLSVPVAADPGALPAPQGAPILTVTGAITETNADGAAQFDAAMLDALPRHSITTSTPWYDKPRRFEGPLLRDVLAAVGAKGTMLRVEALNDYASQLPVTDATNYDVVIADRIDGEPILVRERGPLFIMYPLDQVPELKSEQYYQRCVWQVKSIEVQP